MINPGELYVHYKNPNHIYEIICIAKHSETLEDIVIYKALYESDNFPLGQIWTRPLKMFEEYVNNQPRFKKILN